jgi:hypothetical protein
MKNLSFSLQSNICDYSIILHFFVCSYTLYNTEPIKSCFAISLIQMSLMFIICFSGFWKLTSQGVEVSLFFARRCIRHLLMLVQSEMGCILGLWQWVYASWSLGIVDAHIELHSWELYEFIGLCVTPSRPFKHISKNVGSCFCSICMTIANTMDAVLLFCKEWQWGNSNALL